MNNQEALALCRFAQACCPQQKFDEFTPDAWAALLDDIRFVDAKDALTAMAKQQPFVSPAEIRAEVKRIRARRIDAYGPIDMPSGLDEGPYRALLKRTRKAIADGDLTPETRPALEGVPRPMPELDGVFGRAE